MGKLLGLVTSMPPWLLIGVSLVLVYIVLKRRSKSRNPFVTSLPQPTPVELDPKERDKVLRQNFKPEAIPENLDAIVVGSGIGGLTTASLLAKAGKRVLVLEQHDRAGGCTHTFVEQGFEFDIGIHYIGEMRSHSLTKCLIDQVTDGQLQWADLDDLYDVVAIGVDGQCRRYELPTGRKQLIDTLVNHFPKEEEAINVFFEEVKFLRGAIKSFLLLKYLPTWISKLIMRFNLLPGLPRCRAAFETSTRQFLDKITTNEDLKAVLTYHFGDYGTQPARAPLAMQSLLWNHFMFGSSYPIGGASEIALRIVPTIEHAGGRVLVRAPVVGFSFEGGRVNGVQVERTGGKGIATIRAPLVISNAGIPNTFANFGLPKEIKAKSSIQPFFKTLKPGLACFQVFVGLRGTGEELSLKAQNVWAFTEPDLDAAIEKYCAKSLEEAANQPIPLLFISFPSAKDPTWETRYPGKSTCAIVTLCNWDWFKKWEKDGTLRARGDDYTELKDQMAHQMWQQVVGLFPHLADKVEYLEGGSPLTHNHYIKSNAGEIYGLDHDLCRFSNEASVALRPDLGIPGLLFTGQDVFVCGFAGAMYGGLLCASKALGQNLLTALMKNQSATRPEKKPK